MNLRGFWATAVSILCVVSAFGARADLCSADDVPGATLLLPYFEVDLENPITKACSARPTPCGGKVFQIDPENGAAQGESLVAIEACPPPSLVLIP